MKEQYKYLKALKFSESYKYTIFYMEKPKNVRETLVEKL
jgi:hypothetical protein